MTHFVDTLDTLFSQGLQNKKLTNQSYNSGVNITNSGKHILKSHIRYLYHASMYHDQSYNKIPQEINKKSKQVTRIITHIFLSNFIVQKY